MASDSNLSRQQQLVKQRAEEAAKEIMKEIRVRGLTDDLDEEEDERLQGVFGEIIDDIFNEPDTFLTLRNVTK